MRISRLTVDKLGVKLYDRASAVVAELIANAYDADAERVTVTLPLARLLAQKQSDGAPRDLGFTITVSDDGHGMTPYEAQEYFLVVGTDRRKRKDSSGSPASDAAVSRDKKRSVMGRKGIGKLAPFGICRRIEIISSGGAASEEGFRTSHFVLDFDRIVSDDDKPVPIDPGEHDKTFRPERGTQVRLSMFLPKRVPNAETFGRQLARRFALASDDFGIEVCDSETEQSFEVPQFQVAIKDGTKIVVDNEPVSVNGVDFPVKGWLAFAEHAYKDQESAGVRIYARGKIVATTRDFEQPAGFTGEFATRSYLVGEIHAEWLDDDKDEDFIRTDRQSILWDSEKGDALRQWGMALIKRVAKLAAGPRRDSKAAQFLRASDLERLARERYGEEDIVDAVIGLGRQIGGFASEDELGDPEYVSDLADIILSVAPHQALIDSFRTISGQPEASIDELLDVFGKSRAAEMASYAQIASERVRSIVRLEDLVWTEGTSEKDLHRLVAEAPWLIQPDWSIITVNQSLRSFRDEFARWLRDNGLGDLEVAIAYERKIPDITLVSIGESLRVVELKKPDHKFGTEDYERLQNYVLALDDLFANHPGLVAPFPNKWRIDLIADSEDIKDDTARLAYEGLVGDGKVARRGWTDFLSHAKLAHEAFLDAHIRATVQASDQ